MSSASADSACHDPGIPNEIYWDIPMVWYIPGIFLVYTTPYFPIPGIPAVILVAGNRVADPILSLELVRADKGISGGI